jgi:hypothetical protein
MPIGLCPLCRTEKQIVSSHLIPRRVYEYCRTPDKSPFALSDDFQGYTDRQTQDYLLCLDCEDDLNKGGEMWLLPLLAQYDGPFPFYDILTRFQPDIIDDKAEGYAAARNPEIPCDKLAHFALGVFWKASVHSWSGRKKYPMIELGPYREPVRAFLRSEASFPTNVALTIGVLPAPVKLVAFEYPHKGGAGRWHRFEFYLPGIKFVLAVGKSISDEVRKNCFMTHRARPIVVMDFSPAIYQAVGESYVRWQNRKKH